MKNISNQSVNILNIIKGFSFENDYTKRLDCMDIEHVMFVAKSVYCLGQISCNLDTIKVSDNFFVLLNKGKVLCELAFEQTEKGFIMYDIKDCALNKIEQSVYA